MLSGAGSPEVPVAFRPNSCRSRPSPRPTGLPAPAFHALQPLAPRARLGRDRPGKWVRFGALPRSRVFPDRQTDRQLCLSVCLSASMFLRRISTQLLHDVKRAAGLDNRRGWRSHAFYKSRAGRQRQIDLPGARNRAGVTQYARGVPMRQNSAPALPNLGLVHADRIFVRSVVCRTLCRTASRIAKPRGHPSLTVLECTRVCAYIGEAGSVSGPCLGRVFFQTGRQTDNFVCLFVCLRPCFLRRISTQLLHDVKRAAGLDNRRGWRSHAFYESRAGRQRQFDPPGAEICAGVAQCTSGVPMRQNSAPALPNLGPRHADRISGRSGRLPHILPHRITKLRRNGDPRDRGQ